ncbi:MAG: hypothetical protein Q9183_004939, partial [Haloplaca sp. 2 TL-2023]
MSDTFPDWLLRLPADVFQDVDDTAPPSLYVGRFGAETTDRIPYNVRRLRTRHDVRAISLLHRSWTVSIDPFWWSGNHWGYPQSLYGQASVGGPADFPWGVESEDFSWGMQTAAGILGDVEDLRNVTFVLPGQCLTRYRSWEAAAEYWMKVLQPFDGLPTATNRSYIVECAEGQCDEDAVQCQHRGCLSMAQALKGHTEDSSKPIIDAERETFQEAPGQKSSSPLLGLIPELREEIFGYLMPYHQGDPQGTKWLGHSMSKQAQNCQQGWGRNRQTTAFLVNRQVYRETAKIYFGTNATGMEVRPGYFGFAGHRLDPRTTDLAQLPLSAFLVQHWQIDVGIDLAQNDTLTSKALIIAHPLWIAFHASISLANQVLLANDNMRSVKFRLSGLCD